QPARNCYVSCATLRATGCQPPSDKPRLSSHELELVMPDLQLFLEALKQRNPSEPEFHQATTEVFRSVWPFVQKNPKYRKAKILERLVEPERAILFRVPWIDRHGEVQVTRGYRV